MATKKKAAKKAKPAPKITGPRDAGAFVDFLHKDRKTRLILKKGWDAVIKEGKKKGFKFTKQQLHDHLKEKFNVTSLPNEDEPDTCFCI
jgi:hypothetical protein